MGDSPSGDSINFTSAARKLSHHIVVKNKGKSVLQQWEWATRKHSMLMIPWGILKKLQQADFTIQVCLFGSVTVWLSVCCVHSTTNFFLSNPVHASCLVPLVNCFIVQSSITIILIGRYNELLSGRGGR